MYIEASTNPTYHNNTLASYSTGFKHSLYLFIPKLHTRTLANMTTLTDPLTSNNKENPKAEGSSTFKFCLI